MKCKSPERKHKKVKKKKKKSSKKKVNSKKVKESFKKSVNSVKVNISNELESNKNTFYNKSFQAKEDIKETKVEKKKRKLSEGLKKLQIFDVKNIFSL